MVAAEAWLGGNLGHGKARSSKDVIDADEGWHNGWAAARTRSKPRWPAVTSGPVANPARMGTPEELLAVTEKLLAPIIARVQAGENSPAPGRSASSSAR